jgi:hypothetical protein
MVGVLLPCSGTFFLSLPIQPGEEQIRATQVTREKVPMTRISGEISHKRL